MIQASSEEIAARFDDGEGMTAAMNRGVRAALRRHKLLGESIAVWRGGRVVIIPPEEIDVEPEPTSGP